MERSHVGAAQLLDDAPELENHRDHDAAVDVSMEGDVKKGPDEPLAFWSTFRWKKLAKFAGPGWLMSLAYLDPGNLESDLQQGAYTGLYLTWVLWWATVMGLLLQEMSARIGFVTGNDLAQAVRGEYPRWLNYVIYVMMELAVIGSDIQEVVGSAIALFLLTDGYVPVIVGCVITGLDTFTFLAVQYLGVRYLEALIFVLISTMSVCFFINWGETPTDPVALFEGWAKPYLELWMLNQAVGTIGAVIMPHNLYLHSGLVLSRKVDRTDKHKVHEAVWYSRIESSIALLFSFFINLAVVATNSNKFFDKDACANPSQDDDDAPYACFPTKAFNQSHSSSIVDHDSSALGQPCHNGAGMCANIGLKTEGYALQYGLGNFYLYVWALGLFAAGQASTMVCTYAGQIIMGGCLQIQLAPWKRVAFTRVIALGPAMLVAALTIGNDNLFSSFNEYLNILQSIQLPFAMLPVLHFCGSAKHMGIFISAPGLKYITYALASLVIGVNAFLVVQFADDALQGSSTGTMVGVIIALTIYAIFYIGTCVCIMHLPTAQFVDVCLERLGLNRAGANFARVVCRCFYNPVHPSILDTGSIDPITLDEEGTRKTGGGRI